MILMAVDHTVMTLHSWPHGTAGDGEVDSEVVTRWNRPLAYALRTLAHLCAPGFTFLLGMGVVYFGRSRSALGWSAGRMTRHFLVRAGVLTLLCFAMALSASGGSIWFMNFILFALAVDYVLVGLLWLLISKTERVLASVVLRWLPESRDEDTLEPLLGDPTGEEDVAPDRRIIRSADISWHVHNALLLVLAVITIWWNIWLSPNHGHCTPDEPTPAITAATTGFPDSIFFRMWFYVVFTQRFMSGFPPLAWISFAILGLIYGRIIVARPWKPTAQSLGNILAGLAFLTIFVLTRVLRVGNLSEGCLQMPEHEAHPDSNPYLVSAASFFYIVKYPPDAAFWSFTMAGNHFLLAAFSVIPARIAVRFKPVLAYGTSALFFYVVHLLLLSAFGALVLAWFGHDTGVHDPLTGEPTLGVDQLWAFFGTLGLVLAMLYPLCGWYSAFKRTRGPDSIWRFF
jgi:hypothetical protein